MIAGSIYLMSTMDKPWHRQWAVAALSYYWHCTCCSWTPQQHLIVTTTASLITAVYIDPCWQWSLVLVLYLLPYILPYITGSVLSWLQSYLSNRTQSVRIGHHSSAPTVCTSGVPQGSVLGPLLFATYTSPIANVAHSFQVCLQQYADDTQLFIALNPTDPSSDIANLTQTKVSRPGLSLVAKNPTHSKFSPASSRDVF